VLLVPSGVRSGVRIIIPEIADYEVRRELLRASKIKGLARLDDLAKSIEYLPITTMAMRQAAKLWAQARQQGQPTAGDKTIDGDMILVAQAVTLQVPDVVIATTNVGHLSRFIAAEVWQNVTPS
jgi:predicted nucleic acid-binding protein